MSDEQYAGLIARGVAKINYYTALADAAAGAIRQATREDRLTYSTLNGEVSRAVRTEAERVIRTFGGADRGPEVLAECREWQEVDHIVLFNPECDGTETARLFAEGRRVLGAIPGVRASRPAGRLPRMRGSRTGGSGRWPEIA